MRECPLMTEHMTPLYTEEADWRDLMDRIAYLSLHFMYLQWRGEGKHGFHLALGPSLIRKYPPSPHNNLQSTGLRLLCLLHDKVLLGALLEPTPAQLEAARRFLHSKLIEESTGLFSMVDPRLVRFLQDFLDPLLFPHNLPYILLEVCSFSMQRAPPYAYHDRRSACSAF
jgi:hypothetical protein